MYLNQIGAEGARALAGVLPNSQITQLDLRWNNIGDEGANALAQVLRQNTTITSVCLNGNNVTATGAQALAEAIVEIEAENRRHIRISLDDNPCDFAYELDGARARQIQHHQFGNGMH